MEYQHQRRRSKFDSFDGGSETHAQYQKVNLPFFRKLNIDENILFQS